MKYICKQCWDGFEFYEGSEPERLSIGLMPQALFECSFCGELRRGTNTNAVSNEVWNRLWVGASDLPETS